MASEVVENVSSSGCGHDHDHGNHEHYNDPTLASCCERDERDYARAMALKRLLTAHDPTSSAVRSRQELFQPPSQTPQTRAASQMTRSGDAHVIDNHAGSDDDSDDDLDDGLDELFAARRQQLEAQVRLAAQSVADGFGVVIESDVTQLLQELRATPEVPRVALVVSATTSSAGETNAALLRAMAAVARKFLGTKFVRVAVRSGDAAMRELRLRSAPCVAAFCNGEQVDATPLDSKASLADPATLWEARLIPWLTMCGVLAATPRQETQRNKATGTTARASAAAAGDGDGDDTEPPVYDCGVENCRIRFSFEHEHVGPSQVSKSEMSAWRS